MPNIRSCVILILCQICSVSAIIKTQTITINAPTSGAALNPVGAAINTKLHAKMYNSRYVYGQYSPHGGMGMGAGLYGYSGGYGAVDGYGTVLPAYGGFPGYQYGDPRLPGSYTVNNIYPGNNAAFNGLYQARYATPGVYPNTGNYPYGTVGSFPGYSFLSYDSVSKLSGYRN